MYTYVVMAEHHSLGISSGPRLFECVLEGGREGGREEREKRERGYEQ